MTTGSITAKTSKDGTPMAYRFCTKRKEWRWVKVSISDQLKEAQSRIKTLEYDVKAYQERNEHQARVHGEETNRLRREADVLRSRIEMLELRVKTAKAALGC